MSKSSRGRFVLGSGWLCAALALLLGAQKPGADVGRFRELFVRDGTGAEVRIGVDAGRPRVSLYDTHGKLRAYLGVSKEGAANAVLAGTDGASKLILTMSADGEAAVGQTDASGKRSMFRPEP